MMGTEIFKIDAPWAQKLMKMRVPFLMTPTVINMLVDFQKDIEYQFSISNDLPGEEY